MLNITILAIFLGILSYSMMNIGMGFMKKGAASLPKINEQKIGQNIKNFITNRSWLLGFLLVQIQWILLTLALNFTSVSVITPLMSVGMVTLVLFSYFYLKEPICKIEIIGIIAIIWGVAVLGATAPRGKLETNIDYIFQRMSSIWGIIFICSMFIFSIFFICLSLLRKFRNADILFSISAGISNALGAIFLKAVVGSADLRNKTAVKVATQHWGWWIILFLMVILNLTATIYLQIAYQRGKAIIVAPIFSVLAMLVPVFGGVIIFKEWNYYFIEAKIGLMIGKIIALTVISIGAIVLSIYCTSRKRFEKQEAIHDKKQTELPIESQETQGVQ